MAFCVAAAWGSARACAAGSSTTLPDQGNLIAAVESAQPGDELTLAGSGSVVTTNDAPWVIDKNVTIQGGNINVHAGGIVLNADVTFRNTTIAFDGFIANAIMANGHTLTLENVTCANGARPLNLFCGGLYEAGKDTNGAGTVIIRGKTDLSSSEGTGNIYAGNLSLGGMDQEHSGEHGPANVCQGDARIEIETETGSVLGSVFAGGAQQKIPDGATSGKVILTDPEKYTVSGQVDVRLKGGVVKQVFGMGSRATHMTYTDSGTGYNSKIWVDALSSLKVESGDLTPVPAIYNDQISSDLYGQLLGEGLREEAALSVLPDAKLDLVNYINSLTVASFTGGGKLILGEQQTLTVTGDVTGNTLAAVGGFNFDNTASTSIPKDGHVYIKAPSSQADSFSLAPPSNDPSKTFTRDESGNWFSGERVVDDTIRVKSLCFASETISVSSEELRTNGLPLLADYVKNDAPLLYLDFIPLEICVNGIPAVPGTYSDDSGEGYSHYVVSFPAMSLEMIEDCLVIQDGDLISPIPDGTYAIQITVPGGNTASGEPLTATATLTVGDGGSESGGIVGIEKPDTSKTTIRIVVAAPGGPVKAGTVMAAVYDDKGRLISFGEVSLPESGGAFDVPVSLSGGTTVKAFVADERKPLCPSQSISI